MVTKKTDEEIEENEDNIIKIASKSQEVYNQTVLHKLQTHDQIELRVFDRYLDKAIYLIRMWEAVGIVPVNGFPIKFEKREEDIITNNEQFTKVVNRIVLTKQPELYRFTKN